jgi:hypothetical protein
VRVVRTNRSAIAFAPGRSDRRADDLEAFTFEDRVEAARELAVSVADQEAERRRSLGQLPGELASLLGNPGAGGIRRAAGNVDSSATELDEEEHMQPLRPDGLDGEEVDRDHTVRLRTQELPPRESGALPDWPEAGLAQEPACGGGGDRESEPVEFAGDPLVAPTRVLSGEAQQQLADLAAD